MDHWTADRIADQAGRTFIVTGANSGLGFETARQLAARGGRVVLAARSEPKGLDAVARRLWEVSERLTGVTWNLPAAPPAESQPARPRQ